MDNNPNMGRSISAIRRVLVERFPDCFCPRGVPKKPLKIGISKDVIARTPDIPKGRIGRAIGNYVTGPTYLSALVEGVDRIDLDGNPSGTVSAAHAEAAARMLAPILADMEQRAAGRVKAA